MSTQHTPGPWTTEQDPLDLLSATSYLVRGPGGREHIAGLEVVAERCTAADARLIAAAPDLLNLLTAADRLEELTGENLAVYARTFAALARAAIAKATVTQ